MKKTPAKKLVLRTDTLRTLGEANLRLVAGGGTRGAATCECSQLLCSKISKGIVVGI